MTPRLITVTITRTLSVRLPAEPVGPHLAIAPKLIHTPGTRIWGFHGGFTIVHRPTGLALTDTAACIIHTRAAASYLDHLDLDWNQPTPQLTTDQAIRTAATNAYHITLRCTALNNCDTFDFDDEDQAATATPRSRERRAA